jgi:hypothetical protein
MTVTQIFVVQIAVSLLVFGLAARWYIIVVLALLSAPLPFRLFTNEPANTIIATLPYIWLPAFLVPAALFGHLLVFRYLRRSHEGAPTASRTTVRS